MSENTKVYSFEYQGRNFWGDDLYLAEGRYAVMLDEGMYWLNPSTDPDGEASTRVEEEFSLLPKPVKKLMSEAKARHIIASMMRANEFDESRSIGWLDLAGGINNTQLTERLCRELKEHPMMLCFVSGDGYLEEEQYLALCELKTHGIEKDKVERYQMLREYWDKFSKREIPGDPKPSRHFYRQFQIMRLLYDSLHEWERPADITKDQIEELEASYWGNAVEQFTKETDLLKKIFAEFSEDPRIRGYGKLDTISTYQISEKVRKLTEEILNDLEKAEIHYEEIMEKIPETEDLVNEIFQKLSQIRF